MIERPNLFHRLFLTDTYEAYTRQQRVIEDREEGLRNRLETVNNSVRAVLGLDIDLCVAINTKGSLFEAIELEKPAHLPIKKLIAALGDIEINLGVQGLQLELNPLTLLVPKQNKAIVKPQALDDADSSYGLPIFHGTTTRGKPLYYDLSSSSTMLVGGASRQGKSVYVTQLLNNLLESNVKIIMFDAKGLDFNRYSSNKFKLVIKRRKFKSYFKSLVKIMRDRLKAFRKLDVKKIQELDEAQQKKFPYIIMLVDEAADVVTPAISSYMLTLSQMGAAVGMHLILATQRTTVDVISGNIKNNALIRVCFKVPTGLDSKVILGYSGAETLIAKGDSLLVLPDFGGVALRTHTPLAEPLFK